MQILTLYLQYIYSLILFVVNNKYLFTTNNEIHEHNTRSNNNLHSTLSNLTKFNKGPCISGIKAFNQLPHHLKALDYNSSYFRTSLKRFLHHHSFYTIDEYYEYKDNTLWLKLYLISLYFIFYCILLFIIFLKYYRNLFTLCYWLCLLVHCWRGVVYFDILIWTNVH